MGTVLLHFVAGSGGALLVFLVLARLSGEASFSAPFGVIFVGIACAALAHFLSPWATPVVLVAYAAAGIVELVRERRARRREGGAMR